MNELLNLNEPFILASQSPRRKKLLGQIGLEFSVMPSDIDESRHPLHIEPKLYAMQLAEMKASEVARKISHKAIVLGADTIVVINNQILNKPENEEDAFAMLKKLSGRTHTVFTGVSLVESLTMKTLTKAKSTEVTFRKLSDMEIKIYISTGSPLDKAGAYGIQDDFGAVFISHINGCYYNIVGLPLELLYSMIRQLKGK